MLCCFHPSPPPPNPIFTSTVPEERVFQLKQPFCYLLFHFPSLSSTINTIFYPLLILFPFFFLSQKASASPVLENIVKSNRIIEIRGVPYDAVAAFVRFFYTSRCSDEDMENYGIHLLALSHAYSVPKLKQSCVTGLSKLATIENVVDVLHLAKLCDAPDLYLNCAMLIRNNFRAVRKTEGWKFLHTNDPLLELDIVQSINEHKSRKKRMKRQREEQEVIMQLSEAMECLEHICTEGCTSVAPYDVDVKEQRKMMPCSKFSTCQGLQGLIRHFGTCEKRMKGGCVRCKRLWQLFRLHSSICLYQHSCKVPLCRQFQLKMEKEDKEEDASWKLLVRKVGSAKAMSSLQLLKDKARLGSILE